MKNILAITGNDLVMEMIRLSLPHNVKHTLVYKLAQVRDALATNAFDVIILTDQIPEEENMIDIFSLLTLDEREKTIVFWVELGIEKDPRKFDNVFANAYGRRPKDHPESLESCLKRLLL